MSKQFNKTTARLEAKIRLARAPKRRNQVPDNDDDDDDVSNISSTIADAEELYSEVPI